MISVDKLSEEDKKALIEALNESYKERHHGMDENSAWHFLNPDEYSGEFDDYRNAIDNICEDYAHSREEALLDAAANEESVPAEKPFDTVMKDLESPDMKVRADAEERYCAYVARAAVRAASQKMAEYIVQSPPPENIHEGNLHASLNVMSYCDRIAESLDSPDILPVTVAVNAYSELMIASGNSAPYPESPRIGKIVDETCRNAYERMGDRRENMDGIKRAAEAAALESVPKDFARGIVSRRRHEMTDSLVELYGRKAAELMKHTGVILDENGGVSVYNEKDIEPVCEVLNCKPEELRDMHLDRWLKVHTENLEAEKPRGKELNE